MFVLIAFFRLENIARRAIWVKQLFCWVWRSLFTRCICEALNSGWMACALSTWLFCEMMAVIRTAIINFSTTTTRVLTESLFICRCYCYKRDCSAALRFQHLILINSKLNIRLHSVNNLTHQRDNTICGTTTPLSGYAFCHFFSYSFNYSINSSISAKLIIIS
jgi:hypothetical protein